MVILDRSTKDMVIPKSLGNFVTEGSGGGITPEEAAEIASAVTEEAISEYNIELQVDLEEIRDAVSGNSEDISALSGVTETISQQIGAYSGLPSEIAAVSAQTSANTQDISTLSGQTSANTAQLTGISQQIGILSGVPAEITALSAQTSANTQDIGILSGITSGISSELDALSAVTSGVVADIATLSGAVKEDVILDAAEIDDMSYADRVILWDETYEKLLAGHKIFVKGEVLNESGYYAVLPLYKYHAETNTETHIGGFLYFAQKADNENSYIYYSLSSAGNVTPLSGRKLAKTNIYSLPAASTTTLGGVKIGSGLTTDNNDKLSVKIGEGLGFSGDTLVVSGGSDQTVFVIYDVYAQNQELADFLFQYADLQNQSETVSSGYPMDSTHIYLWLGQDFQGAFGVTDFGFVELFPSKVYYDGDPSFVLTGVFADQTMEAYTIRVGYDQDGHTIGNWSERIRQNVPQISFTRFGNDDRGYLTYDADNGYFLYDNGTFNSGDVATTYPDLIDKLFTDYLFDGGLVFDYIYPVNTNKLYVIKNGETIEYVHPKLSRKEISDTIDGVSFTKEVTFDYGDYKLTAYYGGDGGNIAANVRITAL